jgi:hypothetical protein
MYGALEATQLGVPHIQVITPLHPDHPEWSDLSTNVMRVHLMEMLEVAALRVLNAFCDQHPLEVSLHRWGYFRL